MNKQKGMTVKEYLRRLDILTNSLFIYKPNNEGFYKYQGQEFSVKEFRKKFPLPMNLKTFSTNAGLDGRRKWLII